MLLEYRAGRHPHILGLCVHLNAGPLCSYFSFSRGDVVAGLIEAAEKNNEVAFTNKVKISDYVVDQGDKVDARDRSLYVNAVDKAAKEGYDAAKAYVDSLSDDNQWVSTPKAAGETKTLTTSTDEAVANVFEAPMGYNPGGTDYINTLQDEDKLIGLVGRSDNTLNATFGMQNHDEGTGASRTPNLVNIQYLNAKITGDTGKIIDLRKANDLTKVNIDYIGNNAGNDITVTNIGNKLDGMRVAEADNSDLDVKFVYKQGVLSGKDDQSVLELNDVNAKIVSITNKNNDGTIEGIEKLTLVAKNGVDINELYANKLQELTIKGSGNLEIASLTQDTDKEFNKLEDGGINAFESNGFTNFDASAFKGKVTADISKIAKDWVDPNDSANFLTTTITGSAQDDVFYAAHDATGVGYTGAFGGRTKIVGGAGNDKLVVVDGGIVKNDRNELAEISGIESLEVRNQKGASQTVDFDAIKDNGLEKVTVRDEKADAENSKFIFKNVSKEFADNKKFVIEHSVTKTADEDKRAPELDISLKDATGADDKVTVEVVNGKNTQEDFAFKIKADGIENVNIVDSDTENNTVTITKGAESSLNVSGGKAKQWYDIKGVTSKVVDASSYAGDLRLQVTADSKGNNIAQDIKLGKGDDIVTFSGLGNLTGADKVSGGEGNDVVRGILNSSQTLDVTGVETLYTASTSVIDLDISKGNFDKVVFVSNVAAAQNDTSLAGKATTGFGLTTAEANKIDTTKIVTIKKSTLSEINFSADFERTDGAAIDNADLSHNFNGVKLEDNKVEAVTVNINAALDNTVDSISKVQKTANAYNVGQVTVHGAKSMDIKVADDRSYKAVTTKAAAVAATATTINNLYAKDLETLTVASKGDVDLKTVSGNSTKNNLKSIDATGVAGNFKAKVGALGDGAVVNLGDGKNNLDISESNGNNITVNADNGNNTIKGSEQSDIIKAGNGHNTIDADMGDNTIKTGNGNDVVSALNGNDTYSVGGGYDRISDNVGPNAKPIVGDVRTHVSKTDGAAFVSVGDKVNPDDNKWLAVGKGSDLYTRWDNKVFNKDVAVLDGANAVNKGAYGDELDSSNLAKGMGDNNNNLWFVEHDAAVNKINAGGGNDVAIATNLDAQLIFNGGEGNDAAVGGNKTDVFNGGAGADVFVLSQEAPDAHGQGAGTNGSIDIVKVGLGDSVVGSHDTVYNFVKGGVTTANYATAAAGTETGGKDVLDLDGDFNGNFTGAEVTAFNNAAQEFEVADATSPYAVQTATVDQKNFVKFKFVENNAAVERAVTEKTLANALSYLANKLEGTGKTVAFQYDRDGDFSTTDDIDTFVFQDRPGSNDTLVQLVGTAAKGVQALDKADADSVTIA